MELSCRDSCGLPHARKLIQKVWEQASAKPREAKACGTAVAGAHGRDTQVTLQAPPT